MHFLSLSSSSQSPETVSVAKVKHAQSDGFHAVGDTSHQHLTIIAPRGIHYLPTAEDYVMLVTSQGTQCCLGVLPKKEGDGPALAPGELSLSSAGGARIVLKNNGEIHLNHMVISKDSAQPTT